jgi:ferredoxin
MIIAKRKPFEEIKAMVAPYKKILIVGCGTCVAVCLAGGEKEVGLLASQLKLALGLEDKHLEIGEITVERQCDLEFIRPLCDFIADYEAIISTFIGVNNDAGFYTERCRACHNCYLGITGGVCPVTMCPKGLLNGPCGGTVNGHCEVDPERECAWTRIYRNLEKEGRLDNVKEILPLHPHDRATTPGTVIHPAYKRRYEAHE